jgi:hypothetical protein
VDDGYSCREFKRGGNCTCDDVEQGNGWVDVVTFGTCVRWGVVLSTGDEFGGASMLAGVNDRKGYCSPES